MQVLYGEGVACRTGPTTGHGPHWEGESRTPMMHGGEKSDSAVVAGKSPNNTGRPGAEVMEPRAGAKENAAQRNTRRTQSRGNVLQSLGRIRQASALRRQTSKVRAECVSSARSDLCGGRGVSRVPTATAP